jgi:hypothetical protein
LPSPASKSLWERILRADASEMDDAGEGAGWSKPRSSRLQAFLVERSA